MGGEVNGARGNNPSINIFTRSVYRFWGEEMELGFAILAIVVSIFLETKYIKE